MACVLYAVLIKVVIEHIARECVDPGKNIEKLNTKIMKILTQIEGLIFEAPGKDSGTLLLSTDTVIENGIINKSLINRMGYFILNPPKCAPFKCSDLRANKREDYMLMEVDQKTIDYMLAIAK